MTDATHATLATFRMDLSRDLIVPGVRDAPGVVTGCWTLDRSERESVVLVTFESRSTAEAFAESVRANAEHQEAVGIELVSVRVVEVSARA